MKNRYFKTTRKGLVGNGTLQELAKWIERFVNVLFPENGIEYWSSRTLAEKENWTLDKRPVAHIACYVTEGHSEGRMIRLMLFMRDGGYIEMPWAKTFGSWDESWDIAKAVSNALESIIIWGDVPLLVEMADLMPRSHNWSRETSLKYPIMIHADKGTLSVMAPDSNLLAKYDFGVEDRLAKACVRAHINDWKTVIGNMRGAYAIIVVNQEMDAPEELLK